MSLENSRDFMTYEDIVSGNNIMDLTTAYLSLSFSSNLKSRFIERGKEKKK